MKERELKVGDELDLVEVVRCKDCRFGEEWGQLVGCGSMKGFGITHKPDWYCADGERKDGDGDE